MARVYISYRKADTSSASGRIRDRLAKWLGPRNVVRSDGVGAEHDARLRQTITHCSAMLVVIGRNWIVADTSGALLLGDQRDVVRREVETALAAGVPVIPVLVGGADMPSQQQLPGPLQALLQSAPVRLREDPDFARDMEQLLGNVDPVRARRLRTRGRRLLLTGVAAVLVLSTLGVVVPRIVASHGHVSATPNRSATQTALAQVVHFPYSAAAPWLGCDHGNAEWQPRPDTWPATPQVTCFADHARVALAKGGPCPHSTGCSTGTELDWTPSPASGGFPQHYQVRITVANLSQQALFVIEVDTTLAFYNFGMDGPNPQPQTPMPGAYAASRCAIGAANSCASLYNPYAATLDASTAHTLAFTFGTNQAAAQLDGTTIGTAAIPAPETTIRIRMQLVSNSPTPTTPAVQVDLSNLFIG
jgi:hypothetical protein